MASTNNTSSRRRFLFNSIKIAGLGVLLLPFQKTLANGAALAGRTKQGLRKFLLSNKLILNSKTNIVHLPTDKIFLHYPDISARHQRIIDLKTWETQVKAPIHFNKEKSGITLELLALQKLRVGINDKSLSEAINTVSLAFTPMYKNKEGILVNKHNFRLHELLAQLIALNNGIPSSQKWARFDAATGRINHVLMLASIKKPLPPRVKWIYSEKEFNQRIAYIIKNKNNYVIRLQQRANDYKLS